MNNAIDRILHAAPLLLLLGGCAMPTLEGRPPAEPTPPPAAAVDREVEGLLAQERIDPITDYIRRHQGNAAYQGAIARLTEEREARCAQVAVIYAEREKNLASLARLKRGYRHSCPELVDEFAAAVEHTAVARNCESLYGAAQYAEAFTTCKSLAEQGDPDAQMRLGRMYDLGQGIGKNPMVAYVWFSLAAVSGDEDAARERDRIEPLLTEEQRFEAQERMLRISDHYQ